MSRHCLWLPDSLPPSVNELKGHWATGHRIKKAHRELVLGYALDQRIPRAEGRRRVDLRLLLPKGARRRDPDNLWKVCLDSLVQAGLLVDDGPKWCQPGQVEQLTSCPTPGTYVHLTDL